MDADKWLTLPNDLLVDIFRRLDATEVIRCAGACRLWRHAIADNARCLRPRPDFFLPDLLLGFLERPLQYVPASNSTVPFLVPATGVCVDGRLYSDLLSSRDGLLLLGEENGAAESLCLCTAQTGICRVLPAAKFDNRSRRCMYVLATGYDVSHDGDEMTAVWILAVAVDWQQDDKDGTTYQIFSSTSGEWGAVKCSAKFPEDVAHVLTCPGIPGGWVVVCHSAVSWFVYVIQNRRQPRKCIFSIDLRTERTWTTATELPDFSTVESALVLAVSEDRRLSLVKMLYSSHQMQLWVLVGNAGQWRLRRTIDDVQKLLPNCPRMRHMRLSGFCPRSGYLFGTGTDYKNLQHYFVIGVDGRWLRLIGNVESSAFRFPYEMDSSTYISRYISKMKYF